MVSWFFLLLFLMCVAISTQFHSRRCFPEILFLVAKFCVRMRMSVRNYEAFFFQCWKEIHSIFNKCKMIHWNLHRLSNPHNLKTNTVDSLLGCGVTSQGIQILISGWIFQLCEVSLETYTMSSVILPLSVFACSKCSLDSKVWETYSNLKSSTVTIKPGLFYRCYLSFPCFTQNPLLF